MGNGAISGEVDFVRDIRPILSENCFFCHGPDSDQREADLRLDTPDGAATVIVPSESEASELLARLITDDDDLKMPPPDSNRTVTPAQTELIRRWIDQGASWQQHWSFRPIRRPSVPNLNADSEAPLHNPIDAFVQAHFLKTPLRPAPQADRRTLIRRLSLDLTGLPPTPDETEAFVHDDSPRAYENLITRLIDSPAFGERMTWDWLDAARYADTNGYQGDRERTMWPWRDWVVQSFNNNLPYDQFTKWQVAGDILTDHRSNDDARANSIDEQVLATGFFRNHMINGEGGRIAEENRVEYVMDMAETMGTVWLGLTLNCCRCHDHKYDPLTNEDYYQLFAFFNQTPVVGNGGDAQTAPVLATPSPQQREQLARINARIAALDRELVDVAKRYADGVEAWRQQQRERIAQDAKWEVLEPETLFASGAVLRKLSDKSALASNKNTDNDTYTILAPTKTRRLTGLRLEALPHSSLNRNGLSRSESGNFVLTAVEVSIVGDSDSSDPIPITIESASATFEQNHHQISKAFDGDKDTGWAVYDNGKVHGPQTAVFRFDESIEVSDDAKIKVILRHESKHAKHNIGCFRLAVTSDPAPNLPQLPDDLSAALVSDSEKPNATHDRVIAKAYRESIPEYRSLKKQRDEIVKQRTAIESGVPKVMVMADREEPRETFVLQRGLYNKPTEQVHAAIPSFLLADKLAETHSDAPLVPDPASDRAALAQWLVSDANPLTARVTVNRIWQQLFGIGLVKTAEDFGVQGEIPIQMDLLNWLAAEFRESGWDVKHLIRLITTSHTYRQSSRITRAADYEFDPANRYLARGARYRMPSWMIRDQALKASGLLSQKVGGEPVNTYQPPGIWEEASFGKKTYVRDEGEKLYRRSLYIFWRRIAAPSMLFDSASRQNCTVKISRTNTPLHALQTLNDVTYVEAARCLAQRILQDDDLSGDRQRLDLAMNYVLARPSSDEEAAILLSGLRRSKQQYRSNPQDAQRVLDQGESTRNQHLDAITHASWTGLCLTILNMDETLNRE